MCLPNVNSLSLSRRRSSLGPGAFFHLHGPRCVLRSELMKQAVRCAAVLEMWASTVAPGLLFRSRHSHQRVGLSLGCGVKASAAIGVVFDRHSSSQPVIWCSSRILCVVQAVDVPSHVLTLEQAVANVTRNPCKLYPLHPQPSSLSTISRGPGERLCSFFQKLPMHAQVNFRFAYCLPTSTGRSPVSPDSGGGHLYDFQHSKR